MDGSWLPSSCIFIFKIQNKPTSTWSSPLTVDLTLKLSFSINIISFKHHKLGRITGRENALKDYLYTCLKTCGNAWTERRDCYLLSNAHFLIWKALSEWWDVCMSEWSDVGMAVAAQSGAAQLGLLIDLRLTFLCIFYLTLLYLLYKTSGSYLFIYLNFQLTL